MHKRKKIVIAAVILLSALIISFILFHSMYFRKVTICEPVAIEVEGLNSGELQKIRVFAVTPLNRTYDFQKTDSNIWQCDYGFLKNIGIEIPDTICNKIKSLQVLFGQNNFKLSVNELLAGKHTNGKSYFLLPANIKNNDNTFVKLFSVVHWTSVTRMNKVLYPVILLIIFFIIYAARKKKISAGTFMAKIKQKVFLKGKTKTWVKIILYSILAALIMFYGYLLIAYTISSFITAVLFIITCCFLLYKAVQYLLCRSAKWKSWGANARLIIFFLFLIWISFEIYFRTDKSLSTYNEIQHQFYNSGFNEKHVMDNQNPDLWIHQSNHEYTDKKIEFEYKIKTNNEGLRDIDHAVEKQKDEFRIICIGNSFTEGTGTPQDSTWPKLLENIINDSLKKKVTVFNAGKAGSDLFFGYRLLIKKMLKYKPDIVLLFIASSDFEFYRFRGGFERFTDDGCKFRKGPWWENFYAMSYICRFITDGLLHYKYFFTPAEFTKDSTKAMTDIYQCIYKFQELSTKENFKFALISCDDPGHKLAPVVDSLKQENIISVIDLAEYDRKIEKISPIKRNRFFWPTDGHCNSKGYLMFARGIYWNLKKTGIIDTLNAE